MDRRPSKSEWRGVFHHWDGYPKGGVGDALLQGVRDRKSPFYHDTQAFVDYLLSYSWSSIVSKDLTLEPIDNEEEGGFSMEEGAKVRRKVCNNPKKTQIVYLRKTPDAPVYYELEEGDDPLTQEGDYSWADYIYLFNLGDNTLYCWVVSPDEELEFAHKLY